jgi:IgGFc binding protein
VTQKPAPLRWSLLLVLGAPGLPIALVAACSAVGDPHLGSSTSTTQAGTGGSTHTGGGPAGSDSSSGAGGDPVGFDAPACGTHCSADLHTVIDCEGTVVQTCTGTMGCDAVIGTCADACQAAVTSKQSVGCEYYATDMDQESTGLCFAAFVANTWNAAAHIQVDFAGSSLPVATFARIPSGAGPTLTYGAYDAVAGLAPGEVAILFLAGLTTGTVPCPAPAATGTGGQIFAASDIGSAFHITTDVPVVAYEINPYGGGSAAVTGASLLLPTSAWDRNYVAVTVSEYDLHGPSMNIIAAEDATEVVMLPKAAIAGGGQLPAGPANQPYTFTLNAGQQAQFSQLADLTGSIIQTSKPVGFMAGQPCMRAPFGVDYCDHGEQMIPPIRALGSEYVGVMFRPRVTGDEAIWRVVGVVDGTELTYSSDVGGPAALTLGQAVDFTTDQPFQVQSQDATHPFMLFTYMSGSQWDQLSDLGGYGDPDFVISVPPQQYLSSYVFFTDPTYPETNLVLVRALNAGKTFDDVTLDCAGVLTGWQPVGDYEWTRIDLIRHDFMNQGNCSTGRHQITSKSPFGLWVWGWGSPETTQFTQNVSYGYPGGMNVQPINQVVIQPTPTARRPPR